MKRAVIQQDPENIIEQPVLAEAVIGISKAMEKLLFSGFNRKAIIILVAHHTKVSQRDVSAVIDSLHDLTKTYMK